MAVPNLVVWNPPPAWPVCSVGSPHPLVSLDWCCPWFAHLRRTPCPNSLGTAGRARTRRAGRWRARTRRADRRTSVRVSSNRALRTLVARYINTLALICPWRTLPGELCPRHPHPLAPAVPSIPEHPSRPRIQFERFAPAHPARPASSTSRFDPGGSNQQRNQAPPPYAPFPHPRPFPRLPLGPKVVGRLWAVSCPGRAEPPPGGHYACSANGEGACPLTASSPLRPPGGGSGGTRPGEVPKV